MILVYLIGILVVGIWIVRKQKMTTVSYFLANRSLNRAVIGASIMAILAVTALPGHCLVADDRKVPEYF
ncbi:MAG: hypothetical protein D4R64_02905 [Porphyromonadaceae bacterium]|nr:MAG: hypothetical protein D4R64_02905 [Porphyromonadaceae bacterium]